MFIRLVLHFSEISHDEHSLELAKTDFIDDFHDFPWIFDDFQTFLMEFHWEFDRKLVISIKNTFFVNSRECSSREISEKVFPSYINVLERISGVFVD